MKISYYKFADKNLGYGWTVSDMSPEDIQKNIDYLEKKLLDIDSISVLSVQCDFYQNGCYKSAGYKFTLDDPVYVMVRGAYDVNWRCHIVPCKDPGLINAWVYEFEGEGSRWFFFDPDQINYV